MYKDIDVNSLREHFSMLNETLKIQNHENLVAKYVPVTNPVVEQLKKLAGQTQEQNEILLNQVELLKEENERQKSQVAEAEKAEEKAQKEAKHAKIFSWISFSIATVISIAALIVSIFQ